LKPARAPLIDLAWLSARTDGTFAFGLARSCSAADTAVRSPMLGKMGSLAKTLTLRTAQAFCVVGITAALALAIPRWAFPELYPDEQGWGGLAHAMRRAFFHFDFGVACGWLAVRG
jgi:hypothetical protein